MKISDSTDYWCQGWVRGYEPLAAAEEYLEQKLSGILSSSPVEMIMSFRILPDMYQTLHEKELNETLRTGDHINNGEPLGRT